MEGHGESQLVALDISRPFDRVWHSALLSKLPSYGISEQLCLWFSNYLKNRKLCVVVDRVQSTTHNIIAGVPQGAALAPTLSLLLINDLLSITRNAFHSFAEDRTLRTYPTVPKILQQLNKYKIFAKNKRTCFHVT